MVLLQIKDYRLTTAEILYHMPDYPDLLQTYVWQDMDLVPDYPGLRKFLDFWGANLDGKLHSIRVTCGASLRSPRLRNAQHYRHIH